MSELRLQGQVALVTGASRGIGVAIAQRLAADGARVIVNYSKSADAAKEVVAGIEKAGGKAVAIAGDVSDPAAIKPLFDASEKAFGKVTLLVNNAGLWEAKMLVDVDAEHFHKLFRINVLGPLLTTAEYARRAADGGRVVNISSGAARGAMPGASVYSATKAALEALTRGHALELGSRQITVNTVAPGTTETEMLKSALPAEVKQHMIQNTTLGRLGQPDDIADVVAFLCSRDGRWITGQFIDANGGLKL